MLQTGNFKFDFRVRPKNQKSNLSNPRKKTSETISDSAECYAGL